jgi:signal transduction histidine kinase
VRHSRLFHSTSFRLATLYLGLFTLSVLILGATVYLGVGREIGIEFDERVKAETAKLMAAFAADGLESLAEKVRVRVHDAASLDYRLEDPAGQFLVGNLPSPRTTDGRINDGWIQMAQPKCGPNTCSDPDWERALVTTLEGGAILVVGQELTDVEGAKRAVLVAFAWALAATLALGILGAILISGAFLRRIDAMSQVAQGIIGGNLRHRIPVDADDELGRLAGTFNHMFDRIESLIEANKHAGHAIAHDLRKPMASIVRRLEAVRSDGCVADEIERVIDLTIADVHAVLDTFNALLRIAQIEIGARRANFKPVDLAAIAVEVSDAFQPVAEDDRKSLVVDLATALPMTGDNDLLTQMIANLVENALRHTPEGTRVEVRGDTTTRGAALIISDNGPGVPAADRTRIFGRFYRLDATRSTPGHGLGLSLVAAIAELHGLRLAVADNCPGLRIALEIPG